MKMIFRYGESDTRAQMIADQFSDDIRYTIDCPENFRGQKEQRAWVLDRIAAGEDIDVISNSDVILGQIRLCVAQKMLKPEDLKVIYYENGEKLELKVFPSGNIDPWPKNFMNESINISMELLASRGRK